MKCLRGSSERSSTPRSYKLSQYSNLDMVDDELSDTTCFKELIPQELSSFLSDSYVWRTYFKKNRPLRAIHLRLSEKISSKGIQIETKKPKTVQETEIYSLNRDRERKSKPVKAVLYSSVLGAIEDQRTVHNINSNLCKLAFIYK